ncbi:MAG: hypothetical protein NTY31_02670 [Candidatus Falkowbacteria bacterium]|nr:hypothetical protein [Candidatus Falkowbacteria bacterium]
MKNLLIVFAVVTLSACNQHSPSKYPAVTSADMDIVARKMQDGSLPKASGYDGSMYFANLPDNVLSGPYLTFLRSNKGGIFRIEVTTTIKGPGAGTRIDVDSAGRIIRAWGYSRPSMNYYSEVWPEKSFASTKAVNFYVDLQRAVINYIKNYSE